MVGVGALAGDLVEVIVLVLEGVGQLVGHDPAHLVRRDVVQQVEGAAAVLVVAGHVLLGQVQEAGDEVGLGRDQAEVDVGLLGVAGVGLGLRGDLGLEVRAGGGAVDNAHGHGLLELQAANLFDLGADVAHQGLGLGRGEAGGGGRRQAGKQAPHECDRSHGRLR